MALFDHCNSRVPHYVALGDSLTVGVGAGIFNPGFVNIYRTMAESALSKPVLFKIYAKTGATSKQILNSLSFPEIASHIRHSEIITLTAGGNDLIQAGKDFLANRNENRLEESLRHASANISEIIHTINQIHIANDPFILRIFNVYNPFPNIKFIDHWLQAFNAHLQNFSKYPHVKIADIYTAFSGRQKFLLSLDHIHPNILGYQVMAETANQLGYDGLLDKK
ncbi:lysophospholipase L1-like esterase [Scopulibacillus daqui]|uniref:Lysophospholipase L1-like esterase n=1 Tax=Scopulibacillus daqui TaxID=1469162 RepID=A0ABS2Q0L6_9BACL|nr:GDSL-type esterase/lipase family protein [Scopulibacillus daqui]MBM7645082.1 lysophospholipase L1-like esterase [Scopulibacillus daqui]